MSDQADHANPLDLPEDEQVVYELGEWSLDLQAEAAEVLAESQIPHVWDGTDLVVHLDWEQMVDELLDAVERGATGEVDTSDDELVYELDEWSPEDRTALTAKLDEAGVTHRWESDATLIVAPASEAIVEAVLDGLEFPNALEVTAAGDDGTEGPDDQDGADGQDGEPGQRGASAEELEAAEARSFEVLSTLFLAADRLKGNPLDPEGIADLADALEEADPDVPPYGIVPGLWRDAIDLANRLADSLAEPDDRSEDVMAQATELQVLLRPFV